MKDVTDKSADALPSNRKKRILLVEDESTTRLFLLNQLKKAGLDVDTAATGVIALKKFNDAHFDAVILDLMLPGLKGQDLIREIRKKKDCADTPIFVVTSAQRMDPWRKRGSKAGATRVFDKASPLDTIVAEIASILIPKSPAASQPTAAAAPAKHAEPPKPAPAPARNPEPATVIPETIFTAPKPTQTSAAVKPGASSGTAPIFTPLPSGRETPRTSAPPPPPPAAAAAPSDAPRESKTGFFRNTDTTRTPNTALLRKAAMAGQAARGTPLPAMSGDTPLNIPPLTEAEAAAVVTPKPPPPVETKTEPAAKPKGGLAERIIAPFKIFSRSESAPEPHKPTAEELQEQLAEATRARDELLALIRDQPIFGGAAAAAADSEQIKEAKAAATRAEAAYQAELARSKQFEEELKRIREARDELNRKLADEEKAAAESRKRSKELEERLVQSTSELDQVKVELQKNIGAHAKIEGELREQLNSTRQSADIAKVAYQEEAARAERSTEELVALQSQREQLNSRLTAEMQAAAESRRRSEERERQLREKEGEVDRLKRELARGSAQVELKDKLSKAQEAAKSAEAACKEEAARGAKFEQELRRLKQESDDLNARRAREEQAAAEARKRSEEMERQLAAKASELDRVKADLDRHGEERKTLEKELQRQIAEANEAAEKARRDFQQETTIFHRSKEEVEALRRARDELNTQLEREHQAAAESRRQSQELETRLQASGQELAHLRAELEKHVNERNALVTASSRQLTAAKAAAAKAEKAYQEQLKRSAKFEKELAALREDRTQLDGKLKTELKSTAKSKRKIQELEERATAQATELEKARAQFEKQVSEHQRLQSEHRKVAEVTRQVQAPEPSGDPGSAETRFRESISALARATAQLEKERGDRRRAEQRAAFLSGQLESLHEELRKQLEVEKENQKRIVEFEQQLRQSEDEIAKTVSDLQKETAARQLVEAQLKAKGDMGNQLQQRFNLLDEAKQVFNTAQEKLEQRLQAALAGQKQAEGKLQKQTAERKRVEGLLEEAQRKLQEQSQQNATEIARLQSALELETIERRKTESQSLQSRYASLDASRLGRAFVNSFRTHLRPSADQLLQATRRLLELPLDDAHKKVVEEALENALLLQTSMQNDANLPGEGDTEEAKKAA